MLQYASDGLLTQLAPAVRQRYDAWWRSMGETAGGVREPAALDPHGLLDHPRGLRMALERVQGAESALWVYLSVLECADEDRAAHRVFVDDLAEALLMPPTLIRELGDAARRRRPRSPQVAARAGVSGSVSAAL